MVAEVSTSYDRSVYDFGTISVRDVSHVELQCLYEPKVPGLLSRQDRPFLRVLSVLLCRASSSFGMQLRGLHGHGGLNRSALLLRVRESTDVPCSFALLSHVGW